MIFFSLIIVVVVLPLRFAAEVYQPGDPCKDHRSRRDQRDIKFRIPHHQIGRREKSHHKGKSHSRKPRKSHQPDPGPSAGDTVGAGEFRSCVAQLQRRKVHEHVHDKIECDRHGREDEKGDIDIVHNKVAAPQDRHDDRLYQQYGAGSSSAVDPAEKGGQLPVLCSAEESSDFTSIIQR